MSKITIVGGGSGGFAVASDLALHGHTVTLLEHPSFAAGVEKIQALGGITLESIPSNGRASGFAKLALITISPEEALPGAELVFVVAPAYAQKVMAEFCAPYLHGNQFICLMPGNLHGSIEFLRILRRCGNHDVRYAAEMDSMIYTASRKDDSVSIRGYKKGIGLSVFPSRHLALAAPAFQNIYPDVTVRKNVLATGVSNPNVFIHVPVVLLNFTSVERGVDMEAYRAGFTPGVAGCIEAIDAERMRLAEKGYADIAPMRSILRDWYGAQGAGGDTLYEVISTNPLYAGSKLPKTKDHRYFTEDVPYGICPMAELLEICGLPNRHFASLGTLAGAAWGCDFFEKSRSLASLGLRFTTKELLRYIEEGE